MFGIHDFWVFVVACVLLSLTPGPDTFYILGRSLAQGHGAGVASALGIFNGLLAHTLAAALGLSAVLAASATAFLVIKFAGAAYLIYLGVRLLLTRKATGSIPTAFASSGFGAIYRQGLVTNMLNPKVVLFFLAFMPQFIALDGARKFAAFLTLGLCFSVIGTMWNLCLAWFAAKLGERLRGHSAFSDWLHRLAGTLFIALGVRLAVAR